MTAAQERLQHTRERMLAALEPAPALRLTSGGLLLMAAAAKRPLDAAELTADARAQLDILRERGIIGAAGTPTAAAAPAIQAMTAASVRLTADIAVGDGCATWSAWLGRQRAVVAVRTDPAAAELAVFIVPPGWAPAMAVRWLGITPRPHRSPLSTVALPRDLLQARLAGQAAELPEHCPAQLHDGWQGQLRLWGISAQPGNFGMLVLDAARAGYWLVEEEPGTRDAEVPSGQSAPENSAAPSGTGLPGTGLPGTGLPGTGLSGTGLSGTGLAGTWLSGTAPSDQDQYAPVPGQQAGTQQCTGTGPALLLTQLSAREVWRRVMLCVTSADVSKRGERRHARTASRGVLAAAGLSPDVDGEDLPR